MSLLRWVAPFLGVFFAGFYLVLEPAMDQVYELEQTLVRLKEQYINKTKLAVNLDAHRAQLGEARAMAARAMVLLPDAFAPDLAPVQAAAQRRGLRIEILRVARDDMYEFYARRSVRIRVTGRYHDLGAFVADLDRLPGSVIAQDLDLRRAPAAGQVTLEAWVVSFRYLSDEEVATQRKRAAKAKA